MLQKSPMYSYIPASDLTRARRFYEQVLGFKAQSETNGGVVYGFADNTACFLYPTPNAGTSRASQAFWQVEDLDAEMSDLRARGVTFEDYEGPGFRTRNGVAESDGARAAWFKDTEGNIMALIENV